MFTRSEYSHVGMAWVVYDRVFVLEAVMPLVRPFPLSKLLEDGVFWLPMSAPWKNETEEYAISHIGDLYSQLEAMESPFDEPPDNTLWQCAEYVARTMRHDGIDLGPIFTPSALVRKALQIGATLTYIEL